MAMGVRKAAKALAMAELELEPEMGEECYEALESAHTDGVPQAIASGQKETTKAQGDTGAGSSMRSQSSGDDHEAGTSPEVANAVAHDDLSVGAGPEARGDPSGTSSASTEDEADIQVVPLDSFDVLHLYGSRPEWGEQFIFVKSER